MSDGAFPDRVTLLRNRWEADPSSRIFLQLAEEYRHQGRVKEALDVLDRGLKEHPGYLSALVAKGRCHLELAEPEPARAVLERVVKQDATQMVANKLLVRAYLDTGEPDRARERLDIYTLLNDSDPEIEELRRRLRAMEQPPQAEKPGPTPLPGSPLPEAPPVPPVDVRGRETAPPPSPPGGDIFDLGLPAPRAVAAMAPDEPFGDLLAPAPAAAVPNASPAPAAPAIAAETAAEPLEQEELEPEDVLFAGLASRDSRSRYLAGLAAEGLFLLDLTAEAPPVSPAGARMPASVSLAEEPWPEEPLPEAAAPIMEEPPPVFDLAAPAPWAEEPPVPAAAPPAAPGEPIATATLGELYLKQGHLGEAERIFREVLRREPDHSAAQGGLARAAARQAEEQPPEVLAPPVSSPPEPAPVGARARKIQVLSGYLQRLRQGSRRDVS